jgi:5-methylcytosine-specific restriction protein A
LTKLPIFKTKLTRFDTRRLKPPNKVADPYYVTPQHKEWRRSVMVLAGWQCQWMEDGRRCQASSARGDRLFADHITERKDGGHDLGPGMCLCGSHHTMKTMKARGARAQTSIDG